MMELVQVISDKSFMQLLDLAREWGCAGTLVVAGWIVLRHQRLQGRVGRMEDRD